MAYKAGYSEAHSPNYETGLADGLADAVRDGKEEEKNGPDPDMQWSAMYMRGYDAGISGG
jgi:hypothetical protein